MLNILQPLLTSWVAIPLSSRVVPLAVECLTLSSSFVRCDVAREGDSFSRICSVVHTMLPTSQAIGKEGIIAYAWMILSITPVGFLPFNRFSASLTMGIEFGVS